MKPLCLSLLTAAMLIGAQPVAAQSVEFFKCRLAEGASMEEMVEATTAMLETAHQNGQSDYTVSFLTPLYAEDTTRGLFIWVGSASSFSAIGAFNDYWDDEVNTGHRARWRELSTGCESASVYGLQEVDTPDTGDTQD